MAETSEFMTDLPQSAYLSLSIRRAISAAQQRSHRYVTLEHLLLSLLDDPDALALLEAVRADIPAIKVNAADTVNRNLATLYTPGQFDLRASYKVERVLQTASDDADRLNCQEVDAAFVLAAISREIDNPAADILKRNAFAYSAAMTWLYSHRGKSTARPATKAAQAPARPAAAPAPAPAHEPETVPEAAPMAEVARSEPSRNPSRREDQYSDIDMEVLDDEAEEVAEEAEWDEEKPTPAPAPLPMPARLRETPPTRPAAAAARSAHLSPATKPQPAPARGLGEERPGASESRWSDAPPIAPPPAPRRREVSGGGGGYAPAPAPQAQPQARSQPQAQPRRAETPLPSSARLDEMRLRPAASGPRPPLTTPASPPQPQGAANPAAKRRPVPAPAPQPAPSPAAAKASAPPAAGKAAAAAPADRQKGRPRARRQSPQEVLVGRLLENIPRRMRAAVPEPIEVRISREESVALSRGMEGRTETIRHDILVTQAMSVMLRAPDGGFSIEPLSPETQWIFERPDSGETESYGRWRWVVTPSETGQRRLQLIVAARSIDKNGLVGDTALPDQIITVKVRMNVWRKLWGGMQWIATLVLGGVLTELALLGMRLLEK